MYQKSSFAVSCVLKTVSGSLTYSVPAPSNNSGLSQERILSYGGARFLFCHPSQIDRIWKKWLNMTLAKNQIYYWPWLSGVRVLRIKYDMTIFLSSAFHLIPGYSALELQEGLLDVGVPQGPQGTWMFLVVPRVFSFPDLLSRVPRRKRQIH
jgi:hypothetical protein